MRCTHNTKTIVAAGRFSSLEILFDFEFFMMVVVASILPVAELASRPR